jgi:ribosomal-protein-alanine N-acetyltransferase
MEFARFLPHIPQPFTRAHAEAFVATNMSEPWDRWPTFAVVLDGTVIGTVSFEIDAATSTAMIGYAIGRRWWGCGIATEAARAALAWAIEEFGLVRVWASTELRHVRSQRVLEKLGLRRQAVRASYHLGREGTPVDGVVYALDVVDPRDRIPDVRDGLTRLERVILHVLAESERERGGASVPTAMLYGRVVELVDVGVEEFQAALTRLVGRR